MNNGLGKDTLGFSDFIKQALEEDMRKSIDSFVGQPNTAQTAYEMQRRVYNQIGTPISHHFTFDIDFDSLKVPVPVLERSGAIGENLHALLKEADHPLTNTALEYIQELEQQAKDQIERTEALEKELAKVTKKNTDLHRETSQLKNKLNYHPAYKRK